MFWVVLAFLFVFGLCVGSFLNVCIYRIPLGKSIVSPRSFCPHCHKQIRWRDNIPVVSYFILRGRCRLCGEEIYWRYPLVELLMGVLSVAVYLRVPSIQEYFAYYLLFVAPLLVISFIDLKHLLIPDSISLPGIVMGLVVYLVFSHQPLLVASYRSLLGIVLGGGLLFLVGLLYKRLRKAEGMGGGDVKLMAMIGAFLGVESVLFVLIVSSFIGALVGLVLYIAYRKDLKFAVPYGPFLSLAALFYFFYGREMLSWYLGFCG